MTGYPHQAGVPKVAPTVPRGASPSRWFRANLWVHRWISLLVTLPFLILCLSGTVLIFHDEIDIAMGNVPAASTAAASERPLADSIAAIQSAFPDKRIISAGLDPDEHPGMLTAYIAPVEDTGYEHARPVFADIATATIVPSPDPANTLTGFLLKLHSEWFLGTTGRLLGALLALLVLIALLSGLVVYAPYVKRIAFGVLRRGKGPRPFQLDLHNFIGAVVLGWAVVVSATGVLLGLSTTALGVWRMTELAHVRAQYAQSAPVDYRNPPISVGHAFAAATAAAEQGWHPVSVVYPKTDFSTARHFTVFLAGAKGLDERLLKIALVDAATGKIARTLELPAYLKAILVSEPLHFGDYGGLPLKILWTACTWMTLFITANGAWLWWDRRRRRKGKQTADLAYGGIS